MTPVVTLGTRSLSSVPDHEGPCLCDQFDLGALPQRQVCERAEKLDTAYSSTTTSVDKRTRMLDNRPYGTHYSPCKSSSASEGSRESHYGALSNWFWGARG
jgi:hypothetical protein